MALLVELLVLVLVTGVLGGLVAALADRGSRPGTMTMREMVATAFAARPRSSWGRFTSRSAPQASP